MAPESSVLATTANGLDGMVSTMPTEVALPFAAPDRGTLRKLLPAAIVVVAGGLRATGVVASPGPLELSALPAVVAGPGIAVALALARRHRRAAPGSPARSGRLRSGGRLLGRGVGDALGLVRGGDARLLGAPAWWAFDMAVLWATFKAFGAAPSPAVLVLGYFLGQVANTVPIPGAVSGGIVGVFLAFGMPAGVVLPAVLAYRAVAIWTPVPAGAAALAGLRKRVSRWASEDTAEAGAGPAHIAVPRSARVGSIPRCGARPRHPSPSSRSRWPFQLRGPPPRTCSPIPAPS